MKQPQSHVAGLTVAEHENICKRCRGAAAKSSSSWETLQSRTHVAVQADVDI